MLARHFTIGVILFSLLLSLSLPTLTLLSTARFRYTSLKSILTIIFTKPSLLLPTPPFIRRCCWVKAAVQEHRAGVEVRHYGAGSRARSTRLHAMWGGVAGLLSLFGMTSRGARSRWRKCRDIPAETTALPLNRFFLPVLFTVVSCDAYLFREPKGGRLWELPQFGCFWRLFLLF